MFKKLLEGQFIMGAKLESVTRRLLGKVFKEDALIERVNKMMDHYLPNGGDMDQRAFEERLKQSLDTLPISVVFGISALSYVLKNETAFNFLHNQSSTSLAQILSAPRMPLALMIDDQTRTVREGSVDKEVSSLFDKVHYFETFDKPLQRKYDAIVIGSGPGGSETAVSMLRQNPSLKVLVLDAGREYTSSRLSAMTPIEMFAHLYDKGGVQYATGKGGDTFPLLTGKVIGGTARINSGTFERPVGQFREEIIERHFGGDERRYEKIRSRVESDYSVNQVPLWALNSTQKKFLNLAKEMGYDDARTLFTARSWDGSDACSLRGSCYLGCLSGAKKSPNNVGLVEILGYDNGYVLGNTRAVGIETWRGKATGVIVRNGGRKHKIELETGGAVVVSGGAIGSAGLLLDSGVSAGKNFLCQTQFEVYRLNPDDVKATYGLPQGQLVPLRSGGTAECAHPTQGVLALLATNMHGQDLRKYVDEYPNIEVLGAITRDEPHLGCVKKGPFGPLVKYQHSDKDQKRIRETASEMLEIWASESGDRFFRTNVYPLFSSGDPRYKTMEQRGWIHQKYFGRYREHLRNVDNLFPTSSVHLFASTFDNIEDHTTGRVRGFMNLYVADASAMLQTHVNPQNAIYTIAHGKGQGIFG
jgi:hypothetical protein